MLLNGPDNPKAPSHEGSWSQSYTWFFGPTRVYLQSASWSVQPICWGLANVSNRRTHRPCYSVRRGVLITDSVTSAFSTIYIVYSSTHSTGGHKDKQKKVLKCLKSLTDSNQIWHTPRRDQDALTLIFLHVRNSKKNRFFAQISKIHISKTGRDFFAHFWVL